MEGTNENSPPAGSSTYPDSQEPDQMTQTDALNAVDRFLSFEEEKENMYMGMLHNNSTGLMTESNSELNLSAKVVKYLSTRNEDKYMVRKMDVFDWVDTSLDAGDYCATYNVGPATQMAAEVLEELFNASPSKSEICPNKIEETLLENEIKGTDEEFCVFRHPKRKRTMLGTTLRRSVLGGFDGCVSNRLAVIMDSVKRKKRSPFVKRHKSRHRNLRVCREKNKAGRLRARYPRGSDSGMDFSCWRRDDRRALAIRVDSTRSFSNERKNTSHEHTITVLFSQNLDPKVVRKQKKILSQFGSSTALSMSDATHFVADRFARTKNMLEAIAMGRYVVRHDWLDYCAKVGYLVSEDKFVLRDLKKEKEIGFSMPDSIQRAKMFPLLEGWKVSITPKAQPSKEILKSLVRASRGQVVERLSRNTMDNENNFQGNFFIISCKEEYHMCSPLLDLGINAYDSELLLNGIVTQKLEFERIIPDFRGMEDNTKERLEEKINIMILNLKRYIRTPSCFNLTL